MKYIRTKLSKHEEIKLIILSDLHYGAKGVDVQSFMKYVDMVKNEPETYLILNGDLIEAAQKNSPGSSLFQQEVDPQGQIEWLHDTFLPVKDKILCTTEGNHERRFLKNSGIDVMKNFARELGIQFVPDSAYVRIQLKNHSYTIFVSHGAGGARLAHTKLQKVMALTAFTQDADIIALGHMHSLAHSTLVQKVPDHRQKKVVDKTLHMIITGHFLPYDNYAAEALMIPSAMGAPIIHMGEKITVDVMGLESPEYQEA